MMQRDHRNLIRLAPGEPTSGKAGTGDGDGYELEQSAEKSGTVESSRKPPSLLDDRSEPCPSCGRVLETGAVICIHCGYDLRSFAKLKTQTGVVEVLSPEEKAREDEIAAGTMVFSDAAKPRAFVIGGLIAAVVAVVFAGINTSPQSVTEPIVQRSPMIIPLRVLLAMVDVAMLSAAGLAAAYVVGLFMRRPLGSIGGVAARVFLATACFLAIWNQHVPIPYAGPVLKIAGAIGVYVLVLFFAFRKDLGLVRFVALAHLSLAVLLGLQSYLWSSVFPFVVR